MRNDLIMKDMKDVASVFKKHGVKFYFSYGALLGMVRDKTFIPWDDDIDLDVIDTIDYKTRKSIGHTLLDLGFINQGVVFRVFDRMEHMEPGYNGDDKSGVIVCERNFHFSIFFHKEEGDQYNCYPKLAAPRLIGIPSRFFDKPEKIKVFGEVYDTPGPQKEYLAFVYGKDWKTPIRDLHAPNCITGKEKRE